ncbi:MAG: hypothetical protein JRI57_04660 [Deltaproteobacteria bacterium]|nr:hypothetical protein [Deltaproteobacteria bacterium]MBW1986112.1 hypothetical protein [Deltaproteobacteria bacterium]
MIKICPLIRQKVWLLGLILWLGAACAPQMVPAPLTWPSVVITEDGLAYYVRGLRLPGTRQELRVREAGANTWIPLTLIQRLEFTGPDQDGYRPAKIVLTSGEALQSEISINYMLEGNTDLGYWNMPLTKVSRLEVGTE